MRILSHQVTCSPYYVQSLDQCRNKDALAADRMQVDQATGCEAKFVKCVKEWPIEVVDPNAGTTATHPIRGWVLHKLVGACPTIDTRGTYACKENTPSVRGPPMDSVTGWPGKQTANEGVLILFTVTFCANSANDLTCPPHIL